VLNKELILKELNKLKETIKNNYKVKKIGLFGSYVNRTQTDASDIDFLVEFEKGADLIHYIGLTLYLEELFNKRVEVVSKPALKEELREQILQEVIYE
jgi:predicted nucleotidyltransferase